MVVAAATVFVFAAEWVSGRVDVLGFLYRRNVAVRWAVYQAGILVVVIFGYYGAQYDAASFAYFKF